MTRKKNLISYYSSEASTYDKSRFPWENGPLGMIEKEEISKLLKGERILECGVGTGRNVLHFGNNNFFVGCDISKEMITRCKRKTNVKLILADAESLPFSNEIFDSIICSRIFKFFPTPLNFLKDAKRVLKKDGRCIISLAVLDSFWFRLAIRLGLIKFYGEKYYYKNEILSLSQKARFTGIRIIPMGNVLFGFYSFVWFNINPTPFAHLFRCTPPHLMRLLLKIGRKWFSSYILVLEEK